MHLALQTREQQHLSLRLNELSKDWTVLKLRVNEIRVKQGDGVLLIIISTAAEACRMLAKR